MIHGAGVIVVRKDGAVLMQHRENRQDIFYPDYWVYPGGSVNKGEGFKEAAARELKEETDYIPGELFHLIDEKYTRTDGQIVNRHIYWCIYDDRQEIKCNEGLEIKFLALHELKDKKLIPGQKRLCKLAVEKAKSMDFVK